MLVNIFYLKVVCSVIAVALHYMFLTDFALMLAEGIHIVRMVVIIFPTRSIVYKLIPACWSKYQTKKQQNSKSMAETLEQSCKCLIRRKIFVFEMKE